MTGVAYHEAGHAVVADFEGFDIAAVSVAPDGPRCQVSYATSDLTRPARMFLAGSVAHHLRYPRRRLNVTSFDWAKVLELQAEAGWGYGRISELVNETAEILHGNWDRVDALARALMSDGPSLSGTQAIEAMSVVSPDDCHYRVKRARHALTAQGGLND